MPTLQKLPLVTIADTGKTLMEAVKPQMIRLIGNLMSNNLQCVLSQKKLTVWRTAFEHDAVCATLHFGTGSVLRSTSY